MSDFDQATPAPARRGATPAAGDRLPPHALEAEQGVLGCCLLAPNDALPVVIEKLGLGDAYDRAMRHRPWKFWNDRCYRTIKSMHPEVPMPRTGTHHNALDDAKTQALHLMAILAPRS